MGRRISRLRAWIDRQCRRRIGVGFLLILVLAPLFYFVADRVPLIPFSPVCDEDRVGVTGIRLFGYFYFLGGK